MQYIGEYPVDTLILRVYPDQKSSYTLFEDDGRSFDYEKGSIAKTRFECNETDKNTEFIIHPTEGHYIGISNSRTYQLEIESLKKPAEVIVNGRKTEDWKYDVSGKVILFVKQKNTKIQIVTVN
jgi:alpha-glucosidase (family GH31 glycosyl hydrolase)